MQIAQGKVQTVACYVRCSPARWSASDSGAFKDKTKSFAFWDQFAVPNWKGACSSVGEQPAILLRFRNAYITRNVYV